MSPQVPDASKYVVDPESGCARCFVIKMIVLVTVNCVALLCHHINLHCHRHACVPARRCQAQLMESEATLQKLREQQRLAEDHSSYGQAQLTMINDLLQVFSVKQAAAAAAVAAAAAAAASSPSKGLGPDVFLSTGRWNAVGSGAAPSSFNTNVMVL